MGLSMRVNKGIVSPVLTCDSCNLPIENWGQALVAYADSPDNTIVDVKVFHKGVCDPGGAWQRGKVHLEESPWEQLDNYLPWILWNHNWGTKHKDEEGAKITINVPESLIFE